MKRRVFVREIQRAVAADYHVTVPDLLSHRRSHIPARFTAIYLAKELTGNSLAEIGRRFGDRDHTTIRNAVARVAEARRTDAALDARIRRLASTLRKEPELESEPRIQLSFLHGPLFDCAGGMAHG